MLDKLTLRHLWAATVGVGAMLLLVSLSSCGTHHGGSTPTPSTTAPTTPPVTSRPPTTPPPTTRTPVPTTPPATPPTTPAPTTTQDPFHKTALVKKTATPKR